MEEKVLFPLGLAPCSPSSAIQGAGPFYVKYLVLRETVKVAGSGAPGERGGGYKLEEAVPPPT